MQILCTNDDGYLARGLGVLAAAASHYGDVRVVAPDREQSAASHSLTLHRPLRAREAGDGALVVDGTPTDCVIMAVNALLDEPPSYCLSGVNHGPNMGEDVLYSGTVAAAVEATLLGIPAVAFSYAGPDPETLDSWGDVVARLLEQLLGQSEFPPDTLFNVNLPAVPAAEVRGVRITSLGKRRYSDAITRALDPRGHEYYWIGGGVTSWTGGEDSDFRAVSEGYVSMTPLHLDLTNYRLLEEIRGWSIHL